VKWNLVLHLDNFWKGYKSIYKFLSQDFLDDILIVIISESTAEFVVIHVMLILTKPPEAGDFFSVHQLEFSIIIGPGNDVFVLMVKKQFK